MLLYERHFYHRMYFDVVEFIMKKICEITWTMQILSHFFTVHLFHSSFFSGKLMLINIQMRGDLVFFYFGDNNANFRWENKTEIIGYKIAFRKIFINKIIVLYSQKSKHFQSQFIINIFSLNSTLNCIN